LIAVEDARFGQGGVGRVAAHVERPENGQ
jgi:hypothetical protein